MKTLVTLVIIASASHAWAYGEDVQADDHSTAHYDLELAMARCAGYSSLDAHAIAEADEVTDMLAYGSTAFEFTNRDGPYRQSFHFPEEVNMVDAAGNGPLRDWANGTAGLAIQGACDANGTCCDMKQQCVTKGSLQAVGIWQHAVADYWSHHACIASGGHDHNDYLTTDAAQTAYCAPTMHSHEWGARDTTMYNATLQANALSGVRTMRDSIKAFAAEHGLTACGDITEDQLLQFASGANGTARQNYAMSLYMACDVAVACAQQDGDAGIGDGSGGVMDPQPVGCGCASSSGDASVLAFAVVGLALCRRRKRSSSNLRVSAT